MEHTPRRPHAIAQATAIALALATGSRAGAAAPPDGGTASGAPTPGATASGAASAAARPEPIRVAYAAPAECPDQHAFVAQVLARTPLARPAREGEPARMFTVTIHRRGQRVIGDLTVQEATGESSARTVAAKNCDDVVGALALVAALTIDPAASTAPLPPAPAPAPAPATTTAQPAEPPAQPPRPPDIEPPAPPVSAPPRQPQPTAIAPWSASAGLMGGVTGGVSPGLMPTARLFASLASLASGAWAPAATLSVAGGASRVSAGPTEVGFTWVAGRLDACPVAWRPASRLALRPCAMLEGGVLRASPDDSRGLASHQARSVGWLSAGALASAELRLGALVLRVEGGAYAPIPRYTFVFNGDETPIHRVPLVSGFAALGAGVAFW